eukprot:768391-Hanusia_phi.AAC.8
MEGLTCCAGSSRSRGRERERRWSVADVERQRQGTSPSQSNLGKSRSFKGPGSFSTWMSSSALLSRVDTLEEGKEDPSSSPETSPLRPVPSASSSLLSERQLGGDGIALKLERYKEALRLSNYLPGTGKQPSVLSSRVPRSPKTSRYLRKQSRTSSEFRRQVVERIREVFRCLFRHVAQPFVLFQRDSAKGFSPFALAEGLELCGMRRMEGSTLFYVVGLCSLIGLNEFCSMFDWDCRQEHEYADMAADAEAQPAVKAGGHTEFVPEATARKGARDPAARDEVSTPTAGAGLAPPQQQPPGQADHSWRLQPGRDVRCADMHQLLEKRCLLSNSDVRANEILAPSAKICEKVGGGKTKPEGALFELSIEVDLRGEKFAITP